MVGHTFYYFLENVKTGEEKIEATDSFIADIGQKVTLKDGNDYLVTDYTEEYTVLEEPEDYNY